MNNGLHVPGRINIAVNRMDAPMAEQFVMPMQTANGVDLHVLGGLTKLEAAAIQIAGPYIDVDMAYTNEEARRYEMEQCARNAVDFAVRLLDECRRREEQPPG